MLPVFRARLNVRISGWTLQTYSTSMRVSYCWGDSGSTRNGRTHSGPLSENDLKKGWKVLREDFHDHTKNVRGAVTKAPITYLMRDRIIPLPEYDDNEDEYADFYQQLSARHRRAVPVLGRTLVDI